MTTTPGRRLRVVPPLAGQLSLDLPGIPTAEQVAELAAARTTRRGPAPGGGVGEVVRPRRLVPTRDVDESRPARVARVAVWAVWDEEDLVGVYAAESTARADAAVLRRDAVRSGRRASIIDCLPLQVFTATRPPATRPPGRGRRPGGRGGAPEFSTGDDRRSSRTGRSGRAGRIS